MRLYGSFPALPLLCSSMTITPGTCGDHLPSQWKRSRIKKRSTLPHMLGSRPWLSCQPQPVVAAVSFRLDNACNGQRQPSIIAAANHLDSMPPPPIRNFDESVQSLLDVGHSKKHT